MSTEVQPPSKASPDYLAVVYGEAVRPRTEYPAQLAAYLAGRFGMQPGQKLLEPGCGRAEFLRGFRDWGLDCYGCDLESSAQTISPDLPIAQCNLETEALPYEDGTFDIVYSKSLLEHLVKPEVYLREAFRVLKPGGICLTLVPDWEANYKIYFDDYSHRTPFTTVSLGDIYRICGFEQARAVTFRQLPVVWKYPSLNVVCAAISPFVPVRTQNKFLRWSRELMLIGFGRKP